MIMTSNLTPLKWPKIILALLIVVVLSTGCSFTPIRPAPDSIHTTPFVAPSIVPTQKPEKKTTAESDKKDEGCINNLHFLSDVTIPDGMIVNPGSTIDKRWSVENNGTCDWDKNYKLQLIEGDALGAQPEQNLFPARSGAQVEILIRFIAPNVEGRYLSSWKAVDPKGNVFGEAIYMEIIVGKGPSTSD
jgi:hypothetical protein